MENATEKPSVRTLERAKERGKIPQSSELTTSLILIGSLLLIWGSSSLLYRKFRSMFITLYSNLNSDPTETIQRCLLPLLIPLFMLLAGIFLVVLMSHLIQTGWIWQWKWISTGQSSISLTSVKLGLFLLLGYLFLKDQTLPDSLLSAPATVQVFFIFKKIFFILILISGGHLLLGFIHFFYQKWRHYKDLHMTRQQLKDERRESEGDPAIKAKQRQR